MILSGQHLMNQLESLSGNAPDEVKKTILRQVEGELRGVENPADRAKLLNQLAFQAQKARFFDSALRIFESVGSNTEFPPYERGIAASAAGSILYQQNRIEDALRQKYRAVEFMESLPDSEKNERVKYRILGLLSNTADMQLLDNRTEMAKSTFERIILLEQDWGNIRPRSVLNAHVELADIYRREGNLVRSVELLDDADRLIDDCEFELDFELLKKRSLLQSRGWRWNDPRLIKKLKVIWNSPRHRNAPEVFKVGNQILLAKFLERKSSAESFEKFQKELLDRARNTTSQSGGDNEQANGSFLLRSVAVQAIALQARFDAERESLESPQRNRDELLQLLGDRHLKLILPGGLNAREVKLFTSAIQTAMQNDLKISKERLGIRKSK